MLKQINLSDNWSFYYPKEDAWFQAEVPGCIHTDLMDYDLIPDPFFRLQEKDVQWVENEDWKYVCKFDVPDEVLKSDIAELVFKGIDVYADIILNGEFLGSSNNMFHEWRFACKSILKLGENELQVNFKSPIKEALPLFKAAAFEYPANNDEGKFKVSAHTRKSPYQYGWDWGPRLVTTGLWRPVFLEYSSKARFEDVRITQSDLSNDAATVKIEATVESAIGQQAELVINLNNTKISTSIHQLSRGKNNISVEFTIDRPKLWWPNGYGEAYLYKIDTRLNIGKKTYDRNFSSLGLRKIELVCDKDAEGAGFLFKVNGVKIFMKGANIIPGHSFPHMVTYEKYEQLIDSAVRANMNMLRVWGGGIYEDDYFYDLCDESGILVWQDFMFACGMYPATDEFLESINREFDYNIKRLRNHPCIAIWCGNNEIFEGFHNWGWKEKLGKHTDQAFAEYETIFYKLLPSRLKELDPSRPYWPSSPAAGYKEKLAFTSGDYHYWDIVKEDLPISDYKQKVGRFMSEYGFKSYPEESTLRLYSEEKDWDIRSEVMESHQGWPTGADLVERNLMREYKKPKDFLAFQYVSYLLQAEAIGIAIEAHRRAKPRCWGTLYWQLNDCWPCASWSSIDHSGNWKALHYKVCNVFKPIIVSVTEAEENTNIHIVSDLLKAQKGKLTLQIMDFKGAVLKQTEENISIPANSSTMFVSKNTKEWIEGFNSKEILLFASFKNDEHLFETTYYFESIKDLNLPKANIEMNVSEYGDTINIEISSSVLVKNVRLQNKNGKGFFNDNYFDMLPGRAYTINYTPDENDQDEHNFVCSSLVDTY